MNKLNELESIIRNGKYSEVVLGKDLLGVPIVDRGYHKMSFEQLKNWAETNSVSYNNLAKTIVRFGDETLCFEALQSTKDYDNFLHPWIRKSKLNFDKKLYVLSEMGAPSAMIDELKNYKPMQSDGSLGGKMDLFSGEEEFVKFYLLGDDKKMARFVRSQKTDYTDSPSKICSAFANLKINLKNFKDIIPLIGSKRIFLDVIKGMDSSSLEYVTMFIEKFNDLSGIEIYFKKQMQLIDDNAKQGELLKVFNAVADAEVSAIRKINFFAYGSDCAPQFEMFDMADVTSGKISSDDYLRAKKDYFSFQNLGNDKNFNISLNKVAQKIFAQYLDELGKMDYLSEKNRSSFMIPERENEVDRKHSFFGKFTDLMMDSLWDNIIGGKMQELVKFKFVNPRFAEKLFKLTQMAKDHTKEIINAYDKVLPTKKYQIPLEVLFTELFIENFKHPDFVLIRCALKDKNFNPEIIKEKMFYAEGFHGRAFAKSNNEWRAKNGYFSEFANRGIPIDTFLSDDKLDTSVFDEYSEHYLKDGNIVVMPCDDGVKIKWLSHDKFSQRIVRVQQNDGRLRFVAKFNDNVGLIMPEQEKYDYYSKYFDADLDREVPENSFEDWEDLDLNLSEFFSDYANLDAYDLDYLQGKGLIGGNITYFEDNDYGDIDENFDEFQEEEFDFDGSPDDSVIDFDVDGALAAFHDKKIAEGMSEEDFEELLSGMSLSDLRLTVEMVGHDAEKEMRERDYAASLEEDKNYHQTFL